MSVQCYKRSELVIVILVLRVLFLGSLLLLPPHQATSAKFRFNLDVWTIFYKFVRTHLCLMGK